jgi:peptidoglycan/xylan/chitin deacetylase (PgdA/CDA1 family)
MNLLDRYSVSVLGLDEALRKMRAGSLPRNPTVITFDDGWQSTFSQLLPSVRRRGFPVTVYVTSRDVEEEAEPFGLTLSYLLWATRQDAVTVEHWGERLDGTYALGPACRDRANLSDVRATVLQRILAGRDWKDSGDRRRFLRYMCSRLGLSTEKVFSNGRFRLASVAELRRCASAGIDLQMHTHTHASPESFEEFGHEIEENRRRIADWTGRRPSHFCYPAGTVFPDYPQWVERLGISSATTTREGLNGPRTNPFLLNRIVDADHHDDIEFEASISGFWPLIHDVARSIRH